MHPSPNSKRGLQLAVVALAIIAAVAYSTRGRKPAPVNTAAAIDKLIRPPASVSRKDGVAAAILIDTSGSMKDTVADSGGQRLAKYDIARRCLLKIVRQTEGFAKEQPDQPLLVGIYEFSAREGKNPHFRNIVPLAPPDAAAAENVLRNLPLGNGTPIGDTIVQAKRDLDATGLSRLHILVITDGENNLGYDPGSVVQAIARLPEDQRPGVYFVAFDVAAAVFKTVKDAGALVLSATNEKELQEQLDFIMGNKILLEK